MQSRITPVVAMPIRLFAIATLCVAALLIVGCGEQSVAEKTFGGLSDSDLKSYNAVAEDLNGFSSNYTALTVALNENDPEGARTAVTGMTAALTKADASAKPVENANLKLAFSEYLTNMQGFATEADTFVATFESGGTGDEEGDAAALASFSEAADTVHAAESKLENQLLANASPEQRKEMEKARAAAEKEFDEATADAAN